MALKLSRFEQGQRDWIDFLSRVHRLFFASRQPVPAEVAVERMQFSLGNHLREGFRGSKHGDDVRGISKKYVEFQLKKIPSQLERMRAFVVREEIDLLEKMLEKRRAEFREIGHLLGVGTELHARNSELDKARARIAEREGKQVGEASEIALVVGEDQEFSPAVIV